MIYFMCLCVCICVSDMFVSVLEGQERVLDPWSYMWL